MHPSSLLDARATLGTWRWDPALGSPRWSPELYRIFGFDPAEPLPSFEERTRLYLPSSMVRLQRARDHCLTTGEPFCMQADAHRIDGTQLHLEIRGSREVAADTNQPYLQGFILDRTLEVQAGAALQASEQLFASAFEYAAIGIALVTLDGGFSKVNPALCRMLGYAEDELLQIAFQDITHPDDLTHDLDNIQALLRGSVPSYHMEKRYLHKSGRHIWTLLSVSLVRDAAGEPAHFVSQIQDISERKRAEAERDRFFELSLDLLCVASIDGYFKQVNPAWVETLGWSKEELLARPVHDLLHPDDVPALFEARSALMVGRPLTHLENRYRCKDGSYRWLSWQSSASPEQGIVFAVARDVTRRKESELEAQRAREAAEAANQAKSEFLAMMSHEIRTPMNAVIGFGDLLAETELSPEQAEFVASIQKGGANLIEIIDGILDFSKMEAGKLEIQPQTLHFRALVDDVHEILSPLAQLRGISFEKNFAFGAPTHLVADELALKRILMNLVGNAIKFTESGGVHLDVRMADEAGPPFVRVSVTDTGVGLTPETIERLFQPFVQGDSSHHRKFGGTGLGLVISRRLAEAMGGSLTARARSDTAGATFVFSFPLGEEVSLPPAPEPGPPPSSTQAVNRAATKGMRVLLAEDNLTNRKLMTTLLKRLGCHCDAVEDGAQALQALSQGSYDAVLMDVQMPVLDGWEATREIRRREAADPSLPRQYIIAQSAYAMREDMEKCLSAGMDAHLAKPVTLATLGASLVAAQDHLSQEKLVEHEGPERNE